MAATYESNLKMLEEKLKSAGLYHTSLRPAMNECAKIMTRVHHYNKEVIKQKFRTAMPDGKRPPELMALENASRELLNYLKALGLTADGKRREKSGSDRADPQQTSPLAALAGILAQHEQGDDP